MQPRDRFIIILSTTNAKSHVVTLTCKRKVSLTMNEEKRALVIDELIEFESAFN